ncbi:AmmeMemoRadiSam system radical SAM enzyme [Acetobacterium paludosum]|uniref:AmmeMemoRadiSam system radical SAM enzyme n=1 Tax=Acetobacterium paludosum TaxID=52693 RepID=A0A923KVM2_9FIRM|nr:AmmeMemoRadiSam system radical SAM enzyme [Acetobacterium paludosum]MBC3887148.1 AmmeMemoRadiSam system radical SAM enzyme [Acetobacterium paludosum]
MDKVECLLCPHHCKLNEDGIGFCRARINQSGTITALNYGLITSMALDPIEKKPLRRFFPGSKILSVGSFGCNLRCSFCQNYEISQAGFEEAYARKMSPESLIEEALSLRDQGNIGVAYTYNEPLVGYEFVRDCAKEARKNGLKNVVVTNGCFCEEPMRELLPDIDALNIDLKGFTQQFYDKLKGDLETVKRTIQIATEYSHVEVTTLIVPGENDSVEEIRALSKWLASVSKDIPLHITRFFPNYKMLDRDATEVAEVYRLAEKARESLEYVYVGNC